MLPRQHGVRRDDAGHLLQGFLAQSLADLCERLALGVSRTRPVICWRRMRCSVTRDSWRSRRA
jgi:hypothetical protein